MANWSHERTQPLRASLPGRVYPPSPPYEVEREKIREFARAVGESCCICHDVKAARKRGYPDIVAPPTFLSVLTQRATDTVVFDPELGLNYDRVVHRDQHIMLRRPVCAGDRLVSTARLDSVRSLAGNDVVELRVEISEIDGARVATVHLSLVARSD
ncbi:MaoC family dehydratase N-terminal domain-containing protein [Streptomyces sp. NPDC088260]|uniref:FAS1-like dehydratase domain-containing protein n=1 Tax=Streptomyces sp. NPDC088260 TaxID=3365850 RepID=UPI0038176586